MSAPIDAPLAPSANLADEPAAQAPDATAATESGATPTDSTTEPVVEPAAEPEAPAATSPEAPAAEPEAPEAHSANPITSALRKVTGRAPLLAQIERISSDNMDLATKLKSEVAAHAAAQAQLKAQAAELTTARADLAAAQAQLAKLPDKVTTGVHAELEKVGVDKDDLPANIDAAAADPEARLKDLEARLEGEKDNDKRYALADEIARLQGYSNTPAEQK